MDEDNSHCEEDGIMKAEDQQETAINLSTSKDQHLRACNGDVRSAIHLNSLAVIHAVENGDTSQGQVKTLAPSLPTKSSPISSPLGITGAAKRKAKAVTEISQSSIILQQQLAQVQAQQQQQQQQQQQAAAAAAAAATAAAQQTPLIMLAAQQGLNPQQMQQLLQQQLLNPQQLQQVMQQQTLLLQQQQQQKLQEQLLHQLNEQLQMNILQQSQLLQQQQQVAQCQQTGSVHSQITASDKNKNNKQVKQRMQELTLQQQQLIQQIQLQQRQYLLSQGIGLVPPFGLPQAMSPAEIQQLWKEVASQSGIDSSVDMKNHLNGVALATSVAQAAAVAAASVTSGSMNPLLQSSSYLTNGIPDGYLLSGGLGGGLLTQPSLSIKQEQENSNLTHPLYRHCLCKWPGCDTPSEDFPSFIKHLNCEHQLDDRSTAQARVQMQVVSQLEIQLTREKELLQAMMQHLHMKPHSDKPDIILPVLPKQQQQQQQQQHQQQQTQVALQQAQLALASQLPTIPLSNPVTLVTTPAISMSPTTTTSTTPAVVTGTHLSPSPVQQSPQQQQASSSVGPIRRRVSDKCNLPISAGMQRDMENAFLSFVEIQRNREFYRTTDVRPPFTYASLIRQAIIESPHRQLTLNEIYQWFTNTFAYFRRNEATWKNAVRHNLSLHKCFMRVENVKGAVWTVDEVEFYKRRPQKMSGNLSLKSPNMTQDPSLFGENLNASLRAALGDNNLSLIANGQLPSGPLDGVEDLSMKSQASHLENLSTEPISEEELLLSIKQEPPCETDNMTTTPSILRPSELSMLGPSAGEASLMTPHPSDTAAMMGSNSDTPMFRQNPSDTSLMCSATDVSSSIRSVNTPTMCPAMNSSLMCPVNDTSMMGETSDIYPPSEASGTNDDDNENCAVDFSMVEEPATPPLPPPDRLESNLGVPTTPSELISHSSDA